VFGGEHIHIGSLHISPVRCNQQRAAAFLHWCPPKILAYQPIQ
jgi:hypothetical protein